MEHALTYILHYFVARSLFEIISPKGTMLLIIVIAGVALIIFKSRKKKWNK